MNSKPDKVKSANLEKITVSIPIKFTVAKPPAEAGNPNSGEERRAMVVVGSRKRKARKPCKRVQPICKRNDQILFSAGVVKNLYFRREKADVYFTIVVVKLTALVIKA